MADPEHWKRKILEIEAQKTQASDLSMKRTAHLLKELADYESREAAELAEFERSEEARFFQLKLGRPREWQREGNVPSNEGMVPSDRFSPPPNVLVTHNVFVHHREERVYAFSGLGLSEFYRSVTFFPGFSVPARRWAYGNGMTGESVSAAQFARSHMKALFPAGPDSVTIPTYRDEDGEHRTNANEPQWDSIGFENWVQRLPNLRISGLVDSIRQKFSHYLQTR